MSPIFTLLISAAEDFKNARKTLFKIKPGTWRKLIETVAKSNKRKENLRRVHFSYLTIGQFSLTNKKNSVEFSVPFALHARTEFSPYTLAEVDCGPTVAHSCEIGNGAAFVGVATRFVSRGFRLYSPLWMV